MLIRIGVSVEKNWNTVFPKIYDVCPNHDFLELYGYEKKLCLEFRVKTKKQTNKGLFLEFVSDFSIFVPKT